MYSFIKAEKCIPFAVQKWEHKISPKCKMPILSYNLTNFYSDIFLYACKPIPSAVSLWFK